MSVPFLRLPDIGTMLARRLLLFHSRAEAGVGRRPGAGQGGCGRDEECFGARLAGGNRYPTTSSSRIPTSPA
jgi:hypothetical protein